MRRTLATLLFVSTAALGLGVATPASAVCGGGQPGEACYCPPSEYVIADVVVIPTGVNC